MLILLRGLWVSGIGDWRGLAEVMMVDFKRFSLYSDKLFYGSCFAFLRFFFTILLVSF